VSPLAIILAAVMAHGMGQTIVFAVLAPLGRDVGLPEIGVGLILAASSVVFSWASPRWGRASDRLGRKRTLLIGLLGYTLGTLVFATAFLAGMQGWITGIWLLAAVVAARMFQSTLMAAGPPATTAYVADLTSIEHRTAGMSRLGAAHNLGTIIGPAIGGALAIVSLLLPLYVAAGVTLVMAAVVWKGLPETQSHVSAARPARADDAPGYFDPRVFPFIALGVALYLGVSAVQMTLGFFIQDRLAVDLRETARLTGIAMMICAAASLGAQVLAMRAGWGATRLINIGLPAVMLGVAVLVVANGFWLIVLAMLLLGAGAGLAGPGYMAGASLAVPAEQQGAVSGLVSSAPALGYIAGPLIGTGLYQVDSHLPYLVVVAILLPLVFWVRRRIR
jgi:MFS family permease